MADVLFFNQYFTSKAEQPEYILTQYRLPLNLIYVATYARQKGIDCRIVELGISEYSDIVVEESGKLRYGLSDEKIREIILREKPKIVGIGCVFTQHFWDIPVIAQLVKKTDPDIKVVVGGNHATIFAADILREPAIDYVVRGEGEITFYELASHIMNGEKEISSIESVTYRDENGEIKSNPSRPLMKNIDELPLPDYSLVEVERYIMPKQALSPYVMRYPLAGIFTSRGCPENCVYCTVKSVWGRSWRGISAKKTVDWIEMLVTKYGVREISFLDDSASVNKQRWTDICNEIISRKINIKWAMPNGIAYWTLSNELLDLMKKAGCYRITLGIESGNEETKKFIRKVHPLKKAKEVITHANKIGMWTICTNILGFPYETKEMMQDTVNFMKTSGTDFALFYLLSPHITSDVYQYFKLEGLLDYDAVLSHQMIDTEQYQRMIDALYRGGFATKFVTAEELKQIQLNAYNSFFKSRAIRYILNPLHILRKIRSFEDFRYVMKLLFTGMAVFLRSFASSKKSAKKSFDSLFYKRPTKGKKQ